MIQLPEQHRMTGPDAPRPTERGFPVGGCFLLRGPQFDLLCIASTGLGWSEAGLPGAPWEHVSVQVVRGSRGGGRESAGRTPNWREMCIVKDAFWPEEDCVVQFHPPKSEYVNCHPFVLHLWRPVNLELPRPPAICVGPR